MTRRRIALLLVIGAAVGWVSWQLIVTMPAQVAAEKARARTALSAALTQLQHAGAAERAAKSETQQLKRERDSILTAAR